jgi:5-methyltetrahydropteroyltriglutamate--homocysteine methyltransferase
MAKKTTAKTDEKKERVRISAEDLRRVEDFAIRQLVKRQEELGLQCVTDGELRRGSWHMDFLCQIGGVIAAGTQLRPFRSESGEVRNEILVPKVVDRLRLDRAIFGEDFAFLKSITTAVPKLSIPSPSLLDGLGQMADGLYADRDELLHDLGKVYAQQVRLLGDLGCTYLQIDDTMFAMLGDPTYRDKIRSTTENADRRHMTYIRLINEAVVNKPPGMAICVHTCRGNHRSAWVAAGGF